MLPVSTITAAGMSLVSTTIAAGTSYELYALSGEVLDVHKWSTTEVSGSGTGWVNSKIDLHEQLFLKLADGTEKSIEFTNANLSIRKGHHLSVLFGVKRRYPTGEYVAIRNHTTNTTTLLDSGIISLTSMYPLGGLVVVAFCLLVYVRSAADVKVLVGFGLSALVGLGLLFRNHLQRRRALRNAVAETALKVAV